MTVEFQQGQSRDIRQAIIDHDEAVNGRREKPTLDDGAMKRAARVTEGTVSFEGQPVHIGLHDIDWAGGHVNHQEWPAQLNRFGYLSSLVDAYLASADERYAQAGRSRPSLPEAPIFVTKDECFISKAGRKPGFSV